MEPNEQQPGGPQGNPVGEAPKEAPKENKSNPSEEAAVESWTKKIKDAKAKWKPDFERMRADMNFAAGFQWNDQEDLNDERYICNFVLRAVSQKVAQLYARDPKAVYRRRK